MAGYTAIADIGNALTELLRLNIVPEVLANEESIGVCSPEDKGDFLLGLYLYDIKQSEVFRNSEMQIMDSKRQKYPPVNLELYYMLTAYSNGDVKFRSLEEKMKIWAFPNKPYKLSVFFKVAPVVLESLRIREVRRVMDIQFTVKDHGVNGK